ncbi:MAG TPA: entericidin A/B family lipoprotein [Asticcacaulis sp.]|jgi:predicted small secreted protein
MKRLVIVSLLALAPLLAACHTIQGVGQDITAAGKGLERATK